MTPETFNEELDISAACGDYLRGKYGAHRGHPEWRVMDEAFRAGVRWQAERKQTAQEPVAIVDEDDDGIWAEILPDRTVKMGQMLYAAPPDTTSLLRQAVDAINAELDPSWDCNSPHPKLHAASTAIKKHLGVV